MGSFFSSFFQSWESFLLGNPSFIRKGPLPEIPAFPRLLFLGLGFFHFLFFVTGAVGNLIFWGSTKAENNTEPFSTGIILFALEGWILTGAVIGGAIYLLSRRYWVGPGIQWGWLTLRLAGGISLILFILHLGRLLDGPARMSLFTGVLLLPAAIVFVSKGLATIKVVLERSSPKPRVFISYRRQDSQQTADRIYDYLKQWFGEGAVFQDVESIPPGVDFQDYLDGQFNHCKVFLLIIGPDLLSFSNAHGNRRLDNDQDVVRKEIECALKQNLKIIPLLVDGARMPSGESLPTSLQQISMLNALPVHVNPYFERDMKGLIAVVEPLME